MILLWIRGFQNQKIKLEKFNETWQNQIIRSCYKKWLVCTRHFRWLAITWSDVLLTLGRRRCKKNSILHLIGRMSLSSCRSQLIREDRYKVYSQLLVTITEKWWLKHKEISSKVEVHIIKKENIGIHIIYMKIDNWEYIYMHYM